MEDMFKEQPKMSAEGHVIIRDVDTSEVLLDKYNAINFENLAYAVAMLLANKSEGNGLGNWIDKMAFGFGGTTINANGLVEYKKPNVNGSNAQLYAPSPSEADPAVGYTKDIIQSDSKIDEHQSQPYSDLVFTVTLDYAEPSTAKLSDESVNTEEPTDYVFDEIALVTNSGNLLTHLIFHPIQKSQNRKLEIIYSLRIRAGV